MTLMTRLDKMILLLLLIFPFTTRSQQISKPDSLLNKMTGNWILRGTIAGKETIHDVSAKRILNGQYVQLTEVSRDRDNRGNPMYEATVYFCWQEPKKQYFCLWLDNTSNEGITNNIIGKAKQNGDKIELVFTYGNGTKFYNTLLYDKTKDLWQWSMDGEEMGNLKPFARVLLTRN